MDSFGDGRLSPRLTMPRTMWAWSPSGWLRSILMSRSRCAATLGESVRDALELDLALAPGRLSHGDNVNLLALFGVKDGHANLAEGPAGHDPLLGIGESVIL